MAMVPVAMRMPVMSGVPVVPRMPMAMAVPVGLDGVLRRALLDCSRSAGIDER